MSVGILSPSDNAQCCSTTFTAQGTLASPDTAIASATMTPNGGNPIASQAPAVLGNSWSAVWDPLQAGTYTLSVTGNGGGNAQSTNLDVDPQYCNN